MVLAIVERIGEKIRALEIAAASYTSWRISETEWDRLSCGLGNVSELFIEMMLPAASFFPRSLPRSIRDLKLFMLDTLGTIKLYEALADPTVLPCLELPPTLARLAPRCTSRAMLDRLVSTFSNAVTALEARSALAASPHWREVSTKLKESAGRRGWEAAREDSRSAEHGSEME
jgi:hypothetical protein